MKTPSSRVHAVHQVDVVGFADQRNGDRAGRQWKSGIRHHLPAVGKGRADLRSRGRDRASRSGNAGILHHPGVRNRRQRREIEQVVGTIADRSISQFLPADQIAVRKNRAHRDEALLI